MEALTIQDIIKATKGVLLHGNPHYIVTGVSTDSRTATVGQLFIPLIGERYDAHEFIPQAINNGVKVILTSRQVRCPVDLNVIKVEDTLRALQDLSAYYRKLFNIPIIAVTGSTGKTTTKDMIYNVLSKRYNVLKTQGNYNNEIGLPLTLFQLNRKHEIAVIEMGMSGIGEIKRLSHITAPTIGIITNIGVSHIEKLGSQENILKAKMELFDEFTAGHIAFLNGDDRLLWNLKQDFPFAIRYFGTQEGVSFRAINIEILGEDGISYQIKLDSEIYSIQLKTPGRHNIYNSLAAIAVGKHFKLDITEIQDGLRMFRAEKMRLNISTTSNGIKVIDDTYNASPDSMQAALSVLGDSLGKRKVAILGDMLEMGEYAEEWHREVGKLVIHNNVDTLITIGDDSIWIGRQALELGMPKENILHFSNNSDVTSWLETFLGKEDVVLIKGSRGMKMEEIVSYINKN